MVLILLDSNRSGIKPRALQLTTEHIAALGEIIDLSTTTVVYAGDNDDGGNKAAVRALDLLTAAGVTDSRAAVLGHKDPAATLQYDGSEVLRAAVTTRTTPLLARIVDQHLAAWDRYIRDDEWWRQIDLVRGQLAPRIARASSDHAAHATAQLLVGLTLEPSAVHEILNEATSPGPRGPRPAGLHQVLADELRRQSSTQHHRHQDRGPSRPAPPRR